MRSSSVLPEAFVPSLFFDEFPKGSRASARRSRIAWPLLSTMVRIAWNADLVSICRPLFWTVGIVDWNLGNILAGKIGLLLLRVGW